MIKNDPLIFLLISGTSANVEQFLTHIEHTKKPSRCDFNPFECLVDNIKGIRSLNTADVMKMWSVEVVEYFSKKEFTT